MIYFLKRRTKHMNITEIRIRLMKKDEVRLRAVATITIDGCFAVHDIKVLEGDNGFFISMPSKKTPAGEYKDIVHPLNNETRDQLSKLILAEYQKAVAEADQNA